MAGNLMNAFLKAGVKPSDRFLAREKEIQEKKAAAKAKRDEEKKNSTKA